MDASTEGMIPISTLQWARSSGGSTPRAHQQLGDALNYAHSQNGTNPANPVDPGVNSLVMMGFGAEEAAVALEASNGDVDAAVLQLLP
mmetsp:Transcript_1766/g.2737  ORF Transcript_1766/g.2737 Transcript_1766/m.2737 type:complete len:88 (+) Transcript_1766:49-312(+)